MSVPESGCDIVCLSNLEVLLSVICLRKFGKLFLIVLEVV